MPRCQTSEPGNPITVAVRVVAGRSRPARPGAPRAPVRPPTGHPGSGPAPVSILRRTPVDGLPGALMDLRELTYRNEIVGGSVEHAQELGARIVEAPKFEQGPTECDPRRQIRGVLSQTGLADPNGLFAVTGPPVFLRELRKRNRRRILQDPASKIFNPRVIASRLDYRRRVATSRSASWHRLSVGHCRSRRSTVDRPRCDSCQIVSIDLESHRICTRSPSNCDRRQTVAWVRRHRRSRHTSVTCTVVARRRLRSVVRRSRRGRTASGCLATSGAIGERRAPDTSRCDARAARDQSTRTALACSSNVSRDRPRTGGSTVDETSMPIRCRSDLRRRCSRPWTLAGCHRSSVTTRRVVTSPRRTTRPTAPATRHVALPAASDSSRVDDRGLRDCRPWLRRSGVAVTVSDSPKPDGPASAGAAGPAPCTRRGRPRRTRPPSRADAKFDSFC